MNAGGRNSRRSSQKRSETQRIWCRKHRHEWSETLGQDVRELFAAGLVALQREMAEAVGAILTPFVSSRVQEDALAAFIESVRSILDEAGAVKLVVRGPARVLSAVMDALSRTDMAIEAVVADTAEMTARIDDALVRAHLNAFEESLRTSADE